MAAGEGDAGRDLRAKLTGAMLASDMAAFKAANPGAVFEDVVRWLSPRDWLLGDGGSGSGAGRLSKRMSVQVLPGFQLSMPSAVCSTTCSRWVKQQSAGMHPARPTQSLHGRCLCSIRWLAAHRACARVRQGGMWRQMWDAAAPLAAAEQEPLMDVELEGERALHTMETAAPAAVLDQLLLVAAVAAPALLAACPAGAFPPASSRLARCAVLTLLRRAVAAVEHGLPPTPVDHQSPDQSKVLAGPACHVMEARRAGCQAPRRYGHAWSKYGGRSYSGHDWNVH